MIGFIMLLGMVINNGILLISQTRAAQASGLALEGALRQALDQRLRPILIGALTGVVGALPMAINPGPGAVIYRGLAAVTVGGVSVSLIFTALLVPAALRLIESRRERAAAKATREGRQSGDGTGTRHAHEGGDRTASPSDDISSPQAA
jgi:multidrug efflux pump subunit AcrB